MIKEIKCDLLEADVDCIAHVANCFHTMNSGVALALRNKYPQVYTADVDFSPRGDDFKLGHITVAKIDGSTNLKFVFNIYGQFNFGYDNRRYANYEAVYSGLEKVRGFMLDKHLKSIGLPKKMASDRAGADWRIIKTMIEVVFEDSGIDVIICEL